MKCILLIVDGLGDLPVADLGGRTPLEAAHTPVLDRLASDGCYGLVDPIMPGEIPNTHSGAGILLGLMPDQSDLMRRGPVEAAGLGLPVRRGDIVLRANFATVEESPAGLLVTDRRAGRIEEETAELAALFEYIDLADGISASLHSTDQHRAVLLLSGPGLDGEVGDTDPGDIAMPALVRDSLPGTPAARITADKINTFVKLAHEKLSVHPLNLERARLGKHPATGIITRGAGAVADFENLVQKLGIGAAVVSGCNTVKGLGRMFGFDIISDDRFTADQDTNLDAKIAAVVAALDDHDLVYLHIKAPDLFSHDRQPLEKKNFLERMDRALEPFLAVNTIVAVAADHTTDSNTGFHTADPVPALLNVPGRHVSNPLMQFGERLCREGNMARQSSSSFLQKITRAMNDRTA